MCQNRIFVCGRLSIPILHQWCLASEQIHMMEISFGQLLFNLHIPKKEAAILC